MARKRTYIYPTATGSTSTPGEANACTVRALSNATGKSFEECAVLLERHGRKKRMGAYMGTIAKAYMEAGVRFLGFFGSTNMVCLKRAAYATALELDYNSMPHFKGMTLASFIKRFSTGTYIVGVAGHALCIKDGKIIDDSVQRGSISVHYAYAA